MSVRHVSLSTISYQPDCWYTWTENIDAIAYFLIFVVLFVLNLRITTIDVSHEYQLAIFSASLIYLLSSSFFFATLPSGYQRHIFSALYIIGTIVGLILYILRGQEHYEQNLIAFGIGAVAFIVLYSAISLAEVSPWSEVALKGLFIIHLTDSLLYDLFLTAEFSSGTHLNAITALFLILLILEGDLGEIQINITHQAGALNVWYNLNNIYMCTKLFNFLYVIWSVVFTINQHGYHNLSILLTLHSILPYLFSYHHSPLFLQLRLFTQAMYFWLVLGIFRYVSPSLRGLRFYLESERKDNIGLWSLNLTSFISALLVYGAFKYQMKIQSTHSSSHPQPIRLEYHRPCD